MREHAVPEVDAIDSHVFFEKFVLRSRPLVVRGAVRDWPAISLWSDDYLRERFAGHKVLTAYIAASRPRRFMPGNGDYIEISMAEFLGRYAHDDRAYLTDTDVPAPVHGDLGKNSMLRAFDRLADTEQRTAMYLSHGARTTPLHYDDEENLYCVVHGCKRFQLFDPIYFHHVYPYQDDHRIDHSQIDLDAVDAARFPDAERAVKQVTELRQGDVLYLPCGWWHQVDSRGRSLAVSFVRLDDDRLFAMFLRLVEHGCIGVDPATRRQVMALASDPASLGSTRFEQWCDEPLIAALVRYRICRRRGTLGAPESATSLHELLARRIRASAFSRPVKYVLQNVFAIPLEGYFLR